MKRGLVLKKAIDPSMEKASKRLPPTNIRSQTLDTNANPNTMAQESELAEKERKRIASKQKKAAARRRRRAYAKGVGLEAHDAFDVEWQMPLQADQDWYAGPEARSRALERRRRLFLKHVSDMEEKKQRAQFFALNPNQARCNWAEFHDVTDELSD